METLFLLCRIRLLLFFVHRKLNSLQLDRNKRMKYTIYTLCMEKRKRQTINIELKDQHME